MEHKYELSKLIWWFENFFEKQLFQSMWQENFAISKDPYFKNEYEQPLTYKTIDNLKAKGEEVRAKIKELRNLLS